MDTTRRAMAIGVSGVGVESGLCERVCNQGATCWCAGSRAAGVGARHRMVEVSHRGPAETQPRA